VEPDGNPFNREDTDRVRGDNMARSNLLGIVVQLLIRLVRVSWGKRGLLRWTSRIFRGTAMGERLYRFRRGVIVPIVVVLIILVLVLSSASPSILIEYDQEAAFTDILALEDIGPRVTGSDAELRGAEYTAEVMRGLGLSNVHIEEYPQTLYEVNDASLRLLVRDRFSMNWQTTSFVHGVDFYLVAYSTGTNGPRTFELVDTGHGSASDYRGKDVAGKAVISSKVGASQAQLRVACDHGAAVNIMHNNHRNAHLGYPAHQSGMFTWLSEDPEKDGIRAYPDDNPDCMLPSFTVSRDTGMMIRDAMNSSLNLPGIGPGVLIELDFDVVIETRPVRVTVGDHVGEKYPDEVIMFGGHHDTPYLSPGASDDAEGTITVLAIARAVQGYRTERTMRFLTFGGEEEGVLGSMEYVHNNLGKNGETWVHMSNFDVNGVPLDWGNTLTIQTSDNGSLERMQDAMSDYTARDPELWAPYDIDFQYNEYPALDAWAFSHAGIPSSLSLGIAPNLHTVYDTVYDSYGDTGELEVNPESWGLSVRLFGTNGLALAGPIGKK